MKKVGMMAVVALLGLSSCAPKYTTATQKPVSAMSCEEMRQDYRQALDVRAQAEKKKGFSKENVAWAIFFWPGAVINEMDNRDVIEKVDARLTELQKAATAKSCTLQ
ncbi:hypothetical protein [Deinococcus hopiensis]|uniref:Lipoprotein n=1 Tax=Deinococcus hopiensis KR-140 TaxID=695939 RepID=A0A1W1V8Q4_9DEIO|nr:hypothetical protein [Deinococcus hopiensis]SMB89570.1 hypothetical protein SAMN00790413_00476 [Deinococcus hopiensis KR-140]